MLTKTRMAFLTIFVLFALVLSACAADGDVQDGTPVVETPFAEGEIPMTGEDELGTPEGELVTPEGEFEAEGTPEVEMTPTPDQPLTEATPAEGTTTGRDYGVVPVTSGQQAPVSQSAQLLPEGARGDLMLLSNWMGFEVIDTAGNRVGTVHDYVLNMCEAHIIYVAIQVENGDIVLMPYEVVTLGSGFVDWEERVIVVSIAADEIRTAPTILVDADITDVTWETGTRDYWAGYVTLSNLTTECLAAPTSATGGLPGASQNNLVATPTADGTLVATPTAQVGQDSDRIAVTRIDYASNIIGARLQDGNGQAIGTVEDVILFPETGLLRYLVVSFDADVEAQGYVLIPFAAVNIESQDVMGETVLVLLVERQVLLGAPTFDTTPDTTIETWEGGAFEYWSEFVPMTREQMP